jgi:transcriptional regulator with XRE-family HTH domain
MTQPTGRTATLTQLVADEIRVAMTRRRMSGRDLAKKLNVSPSWVSYRLSGRQPIDLNDLFRIARALDTGVHQLLPSPEVVAGAADESATVAYLALTSRFAEHTTRPRDNRPISGPPRSSPSDTIRTGYLSRTARRKRA